MTDGRADRAARFLAACAAAAIVLFPPSGAAGAEHDPGKGHGGMHGTMHEAAGDRHAGSPGNLHGGTPGDKVFGGPIGAWSAEVRLVDMKAQMAKAKVSPKRIGKMTSTHHVMVYLADPGTKKPVANVKGSVTVTGPGKETAKSDLVAMGDHVGADLTLSGPGSYRFAIEIASGETRGAADFSHVLK